MDRLTRYRDKVKALLSGYVSARGAKISTECQLIFEEANDHSLWIDLGWNESRRIYNPVMHLDIKEGRIWIQENMTDLDPAEDSIDLGVERLDIILGLQPQIGRAHV